jgi:hypothetical protein
MLGEMITFEPVPEGTKVTLVHPGLPDETGPAARGRMTSARSPSDPVSRISACTNKSVWFIWLYVAVWA